jgi:hypothetical protein
MSTVIVLIILIEFFIILLLLFNESFFISIFRSKCVLHFKVLLVLVGRFPLMAILVLVCLPPVIVNIRIYMLRLGRVTIEGRSSLAFTTKALNVCAKNMDASWGFAIFSITLVIRAVLTHSWGKDGVFQVIVY